MAAGFAGRVPAGQVFFKLVLSREIAELVLVLVLVCALQLVLLLFVLVLLLAFLLVLRPRGFVMGIVHYGHFALMRLVLVLVLALVSRRASFASCGKQHKCVSMFSKSQATALLRISDFI